MTGTYQRCIAAGIFAAVAFGAGVPALADPVSSSARVSIAVHDIDFANTASVAMLQRRVDAAVRNACAPAEFGGAIDFGTHDQLRAQDECLVNARASAEPQVRKLVAAGNTRMASN